ncbi:MAG: cytochrome P450 [Ignavibacteriales bacterium]|nr:cytochrome P450 [Ignavibacteriales bacterium]
MNIHELPGYKGTGFLKILPQLYKNPLSTLQKTVSTGERVIPFSFGKYILFLINDPSIIQHILKTNYRNYPRGKALEGIYPLLGKGIFTSDHELWSRQQKNITPAFHTKYFTRFGEIIDEECENFKSELEGYCKNLKEIDLQERFKVLMLKILVKEMFSPDLKFDAEDIIHKLDTILAYTSIRGELIRNVKTGFKSVFGLKYTPPADYTSALSSLEKFVAGFFKQVENGEIIPGMLTGILRDLKNAGEVDDIQIRDEIMTFLFAGFDTVAEGLSWTQYLISTNPGTDEKIIVELTERNLEGQESSPSSLHMAPETPYLRCVISEALRLYPPAWAFYRIVIEDEEIDGLFFPKKSYLMISPCLLHRTPKFWDQPDSFNPTRFEGEDQPEVNNFSYIPFGQGPHICTGRRLAMFEMLRIFSVLTPEYKFIYTGDNPPEVDPGIIMKAKNGLRFKVEKRIK